MYGYGGGPLAGAYGGPANYVNPKMEQWRRQQSGEELVRADDRAKSRIAKAQQTGVGRGTQEQIIRHTTPGGTGYNRQEAMARERELASRPVAEQMAMLGRKANPNAGMSDKPTRNVQGTSSGVTAAVEPEWKSKWTPERRKRWRQEQKDLANPFGPRMRKGEGGWTPEQKLAWEKGETPRQQLAGITGGQAGLDRAWARMQANTGRERQAQATETPWDREKREWQEKEQARKMGEAREAEMSAQGAGQGMFRRDPSSKGAIWGGFDPRRLRAGAFGSNRAKPGFSGRALGGTGGLMSQAIQRMQANRQKAAGPDRSGVVSANRRTRNRVSGLSGGSTTTPKRTGGIGGATGGRSIRSRGRRGMGF